jgi:hypothetical protein
MGGNGFATLTSIQFLRDHFTHAVAALPCSALRMLPTPLVRAKDSLDKRLEAQVTA